MTEAAPVLCLASASPRRRELLLQLGVPHIALAADIDESPRPGEAAVDLVQRLAAAKAQALAVEVTRSAGLPVLGADTIVVVDQQLLGKPQDPADAARMLALLAGREHRVLSALYLRIGGKDLRALSESRVRFAPLGRADIEAYCATREPYDKAGGYAIQGLAAAFVSDLQGSYSGVMGLPLYETAQLLGQAGIAIWQSRPR